MSSLSQMLQVTISDGIQSEEEWFLHVATKIESNSVMVRVHRIEEYFYSFVQ